LKLIVTRAAVADLERLHAFLAAKNPAAAQRVVTALVTAIESLDISPDRGRPSVAGARELIVPLGRWGYVVRYRHRVEVDEIIVLRMWHGREDRE
jgi:plasmid stabilization system protein ParE